MREKRLDYDPDPDRFTELMAEDITPLCGGRLAEILIRRLTGKYCRTTNKLPSFDHQ